VGHRLLPHNTEMYHGKIISRPFFEGWFFKHSAKEGSCAFIPGVFRGRKRENDTAFIQVLFSDPIQSFFVRYPFDSFHCEKDRFEIRIGENTFSEERVRLDMENIDLRAEIDYGELVPLESSFFSPSIMGPFAYLPSMQCSHGVLSLRHDVDGFVSCGERRMEFAGANGYIEKDWGVAFPKSWIWMQCEDRQSAFMCSIAHIHYGLIEFTGLICVLLAEGKQYRFATYNGGKVKSLNVQNGGSEAEITRHDLLLKVTAENTEFGSLKAPTKTGMNMVISESLRAEYRISLFNKDREIFSGGFEYGGLEISNPEELSRKIK
jgi:tocopherol cyclase